MYDNYANRANALMNQALRVNLNVGAPMGNRPAPPVRNPYERDENKIIKPLCPASGRFLEDSPLENNLNHYTSINGKIPDYRFIHRGNTPVSQSGQNYI